MRIDCYVSEKCISEKALRKNIREALTLKGIEVEVNITVIGAVKASALGLRGSPSVLINGKEVQPVDMLGFS